MRARGIPGARPTGLGKIRTRLLAGAMIAARPPVELALTAALRRTARLQPDVFSRLSMVGDGAFLIAPSELPVAFQLTPRARTGRVRVVRRDDPGPFIARISGPLMDLLGLFDGTLDADSAFFSRRIDVTGDTGAVLALHNALEAADLSMADLLGLPTGGRALARKGLAALLRGVNRVAPVEG